MSLQKKIRWALAGASFAASIALSSPLLAEPFTYLPPGDLIPGSGEGRVDETVYAPGMRFPIEESPAYANSQVYNKGGYLGPPGGLCDASNFSYPWRDNYCETRSWDMPLCPAGTGHQGQDIRASTCDKDVHWAVAAADGTVTHIGSYTVYITTADGTRFDYLHMDSVQVQEGDVVTRGQRLGRVSDNFGGTPTSVHLHFNIMQDVAGVGLVFVPPYTSLIASYEELVAPPNRPSGGALEEVSCDAIRGWVSDPDAPETPANVAIVIDGVLGSEGALRIDQAADIARDDICQGCLAGFSVPLPEGLLDGESHVIRAYGIDLGGGPEAELQNSPLFVTCPSAGGYGGEGGSSGQTPKAKSGCGCSIPEQDAGASALVLALFATLRLVAVTRRRSYRPRPRSTRHR